MSAEPESVNRDDLHRAIGGVVTSATILEVSLAQCVVNLSGSPLSMLLVQGERGSTLIRMLDKLLKAVGSTDADESAGRPAEVGLMSAADTEAFRTALKSARHLLEQRDNVVHSIWGDDGVQPRPSASPANQEAATRSAGGRLEQLHELEHDLGRVESVLFEVSGEFDASGALAHLFAGPQSERGY